MADVHKICHFEFADSDKLFTPSFKRVSLVYENTPELSLARKLLVGLWIYLPPDKPRPVSTRLPREFLLDITIALQVEARLPKQPRKKIDFGNYMELISYEQQKGCVSRSNKNLMTSWAYRYKLNLN